VLWSISAAPVQSLDAQQLYQKAAPAVVYIQASGKDPAERGSGTGTIIRADGFILTNAHVVAAGGNHLPTVVVALKPETLRGDRRRDLGRYVRAAIVARSDSFDLALLKIDVAELLPVLRLSDQADVAIGEDVIAIGHPGGGVPWTMTAGRVSGASTDYRGIEGFDVLQTDAAINPGNSGGPLLDSRGEIVGINTFIRREGRDGIALFGLNFAVRSTTATRWLQAVQGSDFLDGGPRPRPAPPATASPPATVTPAPSVAPAPERSDYAAFLDELRTAQGDMPKSLDEVVPPAGLDNGGAADGDGLARLLRELGR
jgi:S1-C subfamily serine protease